MAAWLSSGNNPELKKFKHKQLTCNQTSIPLQTVTGVSLPVNEQILGQPFCSDDFKNDLVGLQSLEVYAAGQGRVQALSETLPYDQPLGQKRVAEVTLQSLVRRDRNVCSEGEDAT